MHHSTRPFDALRPVRFEPDFSRYAEGSVLIHMGNTQVLCNATVDETLPQWLKRAANPHGWVTAEYAMLPRSTQRRTRRESTPKGRTQEIKRLIGRSLRAAVNLEQLGARQIIVDCDVLQADGGTRTASITGGYVALALAVQGLIKRGDVEHSVFASPVAAVSVGMVDGMCMLDLDYEMDVSADVDFNVVMNDNNEYIEVQGTAEGAPFSRADLNELLDLAHVGIRQLLDAQAAALSVD